MPSWRRCASATGSSCCSSRPLAQAAGAFDTYLAGLLARDVRVLLAHPERCPDFQRRPERLAALVRAGALAQVTGASLEGRFGTTVQDAALHMLAAGLVHDLASDAHEAARRGPGLRAGLEAAERELPGAHALADWLTVDVPRGDPRRRRRPAAPGGHADPRAAARPALRAPSRRLEVDARRRAGDRDVAVAVGVLVDVGIAVGDDPQDPRPDALQLAQRLLDRVAWSRSPCR